MANACIRVMVGKNSDGSFQCGREYNFSIGKDDSKIPSETMLDVVEEGIEEKIYDTFGAIKLPT